MSQTQINWYRMVLLDQAAAAVVLVSGEAAFTHTQTPDQYSVSKSLNCRNQKKGT